MNKMGGRAPPPTIGWKGIAIEVLANAFTLTMNSTKRNTSIKANYF